MSFSPTRVSGRREGAHPAREGVGVDRRPSSASRACARGVAVAGRTEPFDGSGLQAPLLLGGHLPAQSAKRQAPSGKRPAPCALRFARLVKLIVGRRF